MIMTTKKTKGTSADTAKVPIQMSGAAIIMDINAVMFRAAPVLVPAPVIGKVPAAKRRNMSRKTTT
jgi:hypothetical protein